MILTREALAGEVVRLLAKVDKATFIVEEEEHWVHLGYFSTLRELAKVECDSGHYRVFSMYGTYLGGGDYDFTA